MVLRLETLRPFGESLCNGSASIDVERRYSNDLLVLTRAPDRASSPMIGIR